MEKWRTVLVLSLMSLALIFNWTWFWVLILTLGIVHILQSGEIHFVEEITKKETPLLYWIMLTFWTFFAAYSAFQQISN